MGTGKKYNDLIKDAFDALNYLPNKDVQAKSNAEERGLVSNPEQSPENIP